MKIKWLRNCEIDIVVGFDEETDTTKTEPHVFQKDEICTVGLLDYNYTKLKGGFRFENGACVYDLPFSWFAVVEGLDELGGKST